MNEMNRSTKINLLYSMFRIRMVEEMIAELYPQQQMRCPVHLCIGQEAIAAGVCQALNNDDYVLSNHRSHGHYLAKGGDLQKMMSEIYGKATGCSKGKGGSMHLIDLDAGFLGAVPIVGSTIPIAVGAAFSAMIKGEKRVSVGFFGEGATEEGVFHESLNFAVLKNLPVIMICENNLYSVYSPLSVRQPSKRDIYEIAQAHGMRSKKADGNDVLKVYELTKEAVERARNGQGPTFLEFATYRWREHCGPNFDNNLGYRTEKEYQKWKKLCPVERATRDLIKDGIITEKEIGKFKKDLFEEIEQAVSFAKASEMPDEKILREHIYSS